MKDNNDSETSVAAAQSNVGVSNTPPRHVHSPLTPAMLNQVTAYIETIRDGLDKHGKMAYNTIGPSYEPEYLEYERLATDARMALNALLKFWQGVEPREGVLE